MLLIGDFHETILLCPSTHIVWGLCSLSNTDDFRQQCETNEDNTQKVESKIYFPQSQAVQVGYKKRSKREIGENTNERKTDTSGNEEKSIS